MKGISGNQHIEDLSEKQRLSLPPRVCEVMDDDMLDFMGEDNTAGYLNCVIAGMLQQSKANITAGANARMQTYEEAFSGMRWLRGRLSAEERERLIRELANTLAEGDRTALRNRCREEDVQERLINLRLNNANCDLLQMPEIACNWNPKGSGRQDAQLFKNRKEFLEALLYDYALRPVAEREAIYFAETIRVLDNVLAEELSRRSSVILTTRVMTGTERGNTAESGKGRQRHEAARRAGQQSCLLVPYRLATDSNGNYTYLAGISREPGNPAAAWEPRSYRLSRIDDVRVVGRMGITGMQRRELDARIREYGMEYVSNARTEEPVRVFLTPKGIANYGRILYNRPRCRNVERVEGGEILTLDCPPFQARNYFYQFGASARLIEPENLARSMQKFYRNAARAYEKDGDTASTSDQES